MKKVKRYRFKGAAGEYVYTADYEAAQSELAALQEDLTNWKTKACESAERESSLREELEISRVAHHETAKIAAAAEQRNSTRDIEFAAKVLANCMDYPWEHMPDNGRVLMRKHAKDIVDAALKPTESGASE